MINSEANCAWWSDPGPCQSLNSYTLRKGDIFHQPTSSLHFVRVDSRCFCSLNTTQTSLSGANHSSFIHGSFSAFAVARFPWPKGEYTLHLGRTKTSGCQDRYSMMDFYGHSGDFLEYDMWHKLSKGIDLWYFLPWSGPSQRRTCKFLVTSQLH